ncbi:MAG: recombinase family protein [Polyangiales bacterium]
MAHGSHLRAIDRPRETPRTVRVLGYARVSSEAQAVGSSLRDQEAAIRAYALSKGVDVAHVYVEAESAVHEKIERRDQIRALMADVRAGDLVVVDKLDRWSRDPGFSHTSIPEILRRGASFYSVSEQCDPSTPEGDSALGFRVMFAREEHKRIRERMVGTRRKLRDAGYYAEGLPPLGYRRTLAKGEKGREKNVLVVDEKGAAIVREAFRLCVSGHSLAAIARAVEIERSRVADVLRARIYVGEIADSGGAWIKGKHPALVDADLFSRAQAALDGRRLGGARPRGAPSETSGWLLRDVATCAACGARMSAAYAGPHEARRYYYRCSHGCERGPNRANTRRWIKVREIDAEAEPLIVAHLASLREDLARDPVIDDPRHAPAADFADRRERLQKKRARYLEAFADDLMGRDELRAALAKLDAEGLRVDADEQATKRPNPLAVAAVRASTLREVKAIARAWGAAKPEAKRQIVTQLAKSVRIAAGQPPAFDWRTLEELAEVV